MCAQIAPNRFFFSDLFRLQNLHVRKGLLDARTGENVASCRVLSSSKDGGHSRLCYCTDGRCVTWTRRWCILPRRFPDITTLKIKPVRRTRSPQTRAKIGAQSVAFGAKMFFG